MLILECDVVDCYTAVEFTGMLPEGWYDIIVGESEQPMGMSMLSMLKPNKQNSVRICPAHKLPDFKKSKPMQVKEPDWVKDVLIGEK